jgi:hypothetical protein
MNDKSEYDENEVRNEGDLSDSFMARQVVQEILNFGINQGQMIKIIQILALELENRDLMLKIDNLIEVATGEGDTSQKPETKSLIKEL